MQKAQYKESIDNTQKVQHPSPSNDNSKVTVRSIEDDELFQKEGFRLQGWIKKEGSRWKTWKTRLARLEYGKNQLAYYKDEQCHKLAGVVNLTEEVIARTTQNKPSVGDCIEIRKEDGKTFYFYPLPDSGVTVENWLDGLDDMGVYVDDEGHDSASDSEDETIEFAPPLVEVPVDKKITDSDHLDAVVSMLHTNINSLKKLYGDFDIDMAVEKQHKMKQLCLYYMLMYQKFHHMIDDYFYRYKDYYTMHMLDDTLHSFYHLKNEVAALYANPHLAELDDYIHHLYPNPFIVDENNLSYDPSIEVPRSDASIHRQSTLQTQEVELLEGEDEEEDYYYE